MRTVIYAGTGTFGYIKTALVKRGETLLHRRMEYSRSIMNINATYQLQDKQKIRKTKVRHQLTLYSEK